jgi:hypothetical protein
MSPVKFQKCVEEEKKQLIDLCDLWENYLAISEDDTTKCTNDQDEGPPSSRTRSAITKSKDIAQIETIKIEDEELRNTMRATAAQGRMLLGEKGRIAQFEQLIQDANLNTAEKPIRDDDLQGFWDMIDLQVVDMKKKFQGLENARLNNWKVVEEKTKENAEAAPPKPKIVSKPNTTSRSSTASSRKTTRPNIRNFIAKKRLENQQKNGDSLM